MPRYQMEHTVGERLMASVWFAHASDDGARLALIDTANRLGLFTGRAIDQALTLSRECGTKVFRLTGEQILDRRSESSHRVIEGVAAASAGL